MSNYFITKWKRQKTYWQIPTRQKWCYRNFGQKISETNQLGQTRDFEYDIKGHLVAVILPAVLNPKTGKFVNPRYEYQYDNFGRQILIRDPNGGETRFEYDSFGNQISRTLPLGFGADGILGTADDNVLPEGDFTEQNIYDDSGRLIKQVSFEGVVTTFTYDDQGRVTSKTFFENQAKYFTNTPKETWTYTYDSQGRVTSICQNERKTETTYDIQGRTTSIKTPEGTVFYEYDKFGRQIHVSSDKGDDIRYEYDIFGRLETVTDAVGGSITTYEYDLVGNLAKTITKTDGSCLIAVYQYDNMNRLIKLTNYVDKNNNGIFDNGEGVSQFDYTLDNLGRKDYAFEKFWTEYGLQENEIDWEYDEAGRLIYEKFDHYDDEFDQTSEWIYDLVGNRLKQTINGIITTYSYDTNDRLLNEVTNNKTTTYDYDHTQQSSKSVSENGEIVSTATFEYDLQGHMSVVTIITYNRTEITKYEYGVDGIRTSAEHEIYENGELKSKTRTEYLNDSKSLTGYSQVLRQTEYDAEGNIIKETSYVIGHQRISQTIEVNGTKTTHYFTFDGHGSTRVLLDAAMAIAQLFAFDAYGNAIGFAAGETLTEFLYSGEQFDSKIGQQYLRARYYDPATGRFNRLDPFFGNLADPLSLHKYLYTHSDSINNYDPTGNMSLGATIGIGLAIGAGLGVLGGFTIGAVNAITGLWTGRMDLDTAIKTWNYYSFRGITFGASLGGVIGLSVAFPPAGIVFAVATLISAVSILTGPDGSADNFFAAAPYFSMPSAVVYIMSNKIKEEAKKRNLPPELISAVLMYEMYQYHIGDALFDDEVITGAHHSIGIAQLRIDNVRAWCPSSIHLTDVEIRNKLYTWNGAIEFLAEAMEYWRNNSPSIHPAAKPTMNTWKNSDQQTKEKAAALYSSCKDDDFQTVLYAINDINSGGESNAGKIFGGYGLRQTQFLMNWFGLFK